jgi:hypothetical protein
VRSRICTACDGLGWFLGPAALLLIFALLNLLLTLDVQTSTGGPVHLDLADWLITMLPTGTAVGVLVAGLAHRYVERHPRLEDFGFGFGIDPGFIAERLDSPDRSSATNARPTAKT